MTIATANSGSSGVSGDMALTTGESASGGDGGVYGGDGQRDWRRGGCDFQHERGGWQHRRRRAVTVDGARPPLTAPREGALTLTAGIGDGSSGAVRWRRVHRGGVGANTGGAVSVTSGATTADDSGSMTIATANSGSSGRRRSGADNWGVGRRRRRGRLRWSGRRPPAGGEHRGGRPPPARWEGWQHHLTGRRLR